MEDKIRLVRTLIPDLDTDDLIFTDDQIKDYLTIWDGRIRLAAASAMDAIANSEALTIKYVKTDDMLINGVLPADHLRKTAQNLRLADRDSERGDAQDFFAIVPTGGTQSGPLELAQSMYSCCGGARCYCGRFSMV